MDSESLTKFCKKIPKLELHAHLNGSLSIETLEKLFTLANLPKEECTIKNSEDRTLDECFQIFDLVYKATSSPESVEIAVIETIKDFINDNVMYIELRTTPRAVEGRMTKRQYLDAVIKGIEQTKDIIIKLLISLNRSLDSKDLREILDLAIEYRNLYPKLVVGIDVSGNPNKGTWLPDLVGEAKANGLYTVIHCAEIPNEKEVMEILKFKPNRIGHGSCIHPKHGGNRKLWKLLIDSFIPVECCLTSNIKCKIHSSYREHHLKQLLNSHHPVAICTDDKGVFDTTLSQEYEIAARNLDLSTTELVNITFNTITYAFATPEEKIILSKKLLNWVKTLSDNK